MFCCHNTRTKQKTYERNFFHFQSTNKKNLGNKHCNKYQFCSDTARVMFFTSEIDFIISGEKRISLRNEVPFELCTIFSFFAKSNCLLITKKKQNNIYDEGNDEFL